jgi:thiol-disulfide isomerase/thioredoxin
MSRLLQTVYARVFKPYKVTIIVAIVSIFFIIAAVYGYRRFYSSKQDVAVFSDVANAPENGQTITVYFFNVDWCPHCTKSKPEWDTFSKNYNGQLVNGYKISCYDVNCTDDSKPKIKQMLQQYSIESYPTVKAVKPDSTGKDIVVDYDARVTTVNLEKFVVSVSQG